MALETSFCVTLYGSTLIKQSSWHSTAHLTWFFRSSLGQGRPPLKGFSRSHFDLTFSPLPQEVLQGDQGDQSLSLQSSGQGMWQSSSTKPGGGWGGIKHANDQSRGSGRDRAASTNHWWGLHEAAPTPRPPSHLQWHGEPEGSSLFWLMTWPLAATRSGCSREEWMWGGDEARVRGDADLPDSLHRSGRTRWPPWSMQATARNRRPCPHSLASRRACQPWREPATGTSCRMQDDQFP